MKFMSGKNIGNMHYGNVYNDVIDDVIIFPNFSKMALSKEQAKDVSKLYFQTQSPVTVIRSMQKKYPNEKRITKQQILRMVKRFENCGTVADGRHSNTGRPRAVRKEETIDQVRQIIEETPQKSVRSVLYDVTNTASCSSVY